MLTWRYCKGKRRTSILETLVASNAVSSERQTLSKFNRSKLFFILFENPQH